jgi:Cytochrome P460
LYPRLDIAEVWISVIERRTILFAAAVTLGVTALVFGTSHKPATVHAAVILDAAAPYTPAYTKDGGLVPPLQYREWIYLTTGLNMSYFPNANPDMSMFDNVFVNPEAYRSFQATGTWPDKTVMVLESRGAATKGSINKSGHFQSGNMMGLEVHVKDEARFPGKWAFFDVASENKATLFPQTAACYSCHAQHAAVDTTFVQFYPTLLPVAKAKGTLSTAYLKEEAAK